MIHLSALKFGICWWNTGLSPLSRSRATPEQLKFAIETLVELVDRFEIDLIALGEVDETNSEDLKAALKADFSVFMGREDMDGLHFDTALLYRADKFKILASSTLTIRYGKTGLRLGEQIQLYCLENNADLNIVISHWNSRIYEVEGAPSRDDLGMRMRDISNSIQVGGQPHFMVIGDLNDEPFSRPVAGAMLGTQDRAFALKHQGYLYNPFWRLLGESTHSKLGEAKIGPGGTYFQHKGNPTRWKVFDQMLFSPAFLRASKFMLDEESVKIFHNDSLLQKLFQIEGRIVDHLPIIAHIDIGA